MMTRHPMSGGPKKTIAKSVIKAARPDNRDGHYGSDTVKKKKHGGKVGGKMPSARPDRRARGGAINNDSVVGLATTGEANGDNKQKPTGYKSGGGIHIKKENKGLLHKDTDTPAGKKIPEAKIKAAEHSESPKVRKRAVFAENAKSWNKG